MSGLKDYMICNIQRTQQDAYAVSTPIFYLSYVPPNPILDTFYYNAQTGVETAVEPIVSFSIKKMIYDHEKKNATVDGVEHRSYDSVAEILSTVPLSDVCKDPSTAIFFIGKQGASIAKASHRGLGNTVLYKKFLPFAVTTNMYTYVPMPDLLTEDNVYYLMYVGNNQLDRPIIKIDNKYFKHPRFDDMVRKISIA